MKKDKNNKIDLSRYKDSGGLTVKKMDFGLWLSKNRKLFSKIIVISLAIISAFFIIYSTYNYIVYFTEGEPADNFLEANNGILSPRNITESIKISTLDIFMNEPNYDLAAQITNPNEKFMARFSYCFNQSETEVSCGNNFILPKEEKYILALNKYLDPNNTNVEFILKKVDWQRVDSRDIPNWEQFRNERLNFAIENLNFNSASKSGLSEKLGLNALEFMVNNKSPYSFYEVIFNILLFNGSELVGVQRYSTSDFLTGETRSARIIWADKLPIVSDTVIMPEVNILDKDVYLKYKGTSGN